MLLWGIALPNLRSRTTVISCPGGTIGRKPDGLFGLTKMGLGMTFDIHERIHETSLSVMKNEEKKPCIRPRIGSIHGYEEERFRLESESQSLPIFLDNLRAGNVDHDLVTAAANPTDTVAAPQTLYPVIRHDAHAAHDLHGIINDFHCRLRPV